MIWEPSDHSDTINNDHAWVLSLNRACILTAHEYTQTG